MISKVRFFILHISAFLLQVGSKEYEWVAVAYIVNRDLDSAIAVWRRMKIMDLHPSLSLVRRLVTAMARQGLAEECEEILDVEKSNAGITDVGCWNATILAWAKRGDHSAVARVVKAMKSKGVEQDENTKKCLLYFCKSCATAQGKHVLEKLPNGAQNGAQQNELPQDEPAHRSTLCDNPQS